ncbi:DUF1871 family protein [Bacillus sp. MUM 13]|uniref:DUF1871 family protein n=1 Tax=Bacillus sp. MUM 13 TaxID=1678001 RepID=UPI0008F590F3|nr:DUF1871 family protein [Bacillus sp. MUM 13]OIK13898.1 hypothetical protein BIV59_04315 [Bacillus sp. MUM 13]
MENQQMNIELVAALQNWDPFQLGEDFYETEIADVLMSMRECKTSLQLAEKIQDIYEFSFEEVLDIEKCQSMASHLFFIKNNASCSI